MTIHDAIKNSRKELLKFYDTGEAQELATWIVEYVTGFDRTLMAQSSAIQINSIAAQKIDFILTRLLDHEPIQYVLNEAWFYGMKFFVDENVLIPRPETEELVEWLLAELKSKEEPIKIIDIGTGSGCIPITIKKKKPDAELWAVDISSEALTVAAKNASLKNTEIKFVEMDFLRRIYSDLPVFDIIISNPPYVTTGEKDSMEPNVLKYEPAAALFVPDNDPLVFYKAIAEFGKSHLNKGGIIFCEINRDHGLACLEVFENTGYRAELRKDMQGNDRMIRCYRG